ncbi:circadian clock KaiB family protein [Chloroflexus sp.]|uniref:circadian clock KaiB family protein n=1 Tax=Chloroflexus sp. TaxID=1904827 RepID=UPI0029FB6C73|nr:circadian clock KaiB family protein [Chloroflexus sp.]MCS6887075.1 circadian clock protein KaiB [Chloroflexus sp.]
MSKIVLHLYIAGQTPRAERAISTLRRMIEHELAGYNCELTIIDVLADPQQAENQKILATPTLIKSAPPPYRRVIGDLSSVTDLLNVLNLPPQS